MVMSLIGVSAQQHKRSCDDRRVQRTECMGSVRCLANVSDHLKYWTAVRSWLYGRRGDCMQCVAPGFTMQQHKVVQHALLAFARVE